jgi:hypothetical protein
VSPYRTAEEGRQVEAVTEPLRGWLTVAEASRRAGCVRQTIHAAAKKGQIELRRLSNGLCLVHEDEFARWAAERKPKGRRPFGLSPRQAELLLSLHLGHRGVHDYSYFITTTRALEKRGLLQSNGYGHRLTSEGIEVAERLRRQACDELPADAGIREDRWRA